jgi:hypothetical protein
MVAVVRVVRQLVQQSGQFFSSCSICHTGCSLRFGRFISGTGIKIFPICASEKGHSLPRVAPRVGICTPCRFHPILFYLIVYGSLSVTDQRSVENLAMINCLFRRCCQVYYLGMDSFTKSRISHLRQEIVTLQHENALYRSRHIRSPLLDRANESRRFRLMEIQEELVTMGMPARKKP